MGEHAFLPEHGNYKDLLSYRKSVVIYDATVVFCDRFFHKYDRTHSQMVQAARSGKQNIVEGCAASMASRETEIKLITVARASLEELLEDYRDFLRVKELPLWAGNSESAKSVRRMIHHPEESRSYVLNASALGAPEVAANTTICLIHQANFLLDRLLLSLEKAFLEQGGLRETMYRARQRSRGK